jgi:hypothetical protein
MKETEVNEGKSAASFCCQFLLPVPAASSCCQFLLPVSAGSQIYFAAFI